VEGIHRDIHLLATRAHKVEDTKNKILSWHLNLDPGHIEDTNEYINKPIDVHINMDEYFEDQPKAKMKFASSGLVNFTLLEKYLDWLNRLITSKEFHKDTTENTALQDLENAAKNAVKFGIGNCRENAALVINFLLEYDYHSPPFPLSLLKRSKISMMIMFLL